MPDPAADGYLYAHVREMWANPRSRLTRTLRGSSPGNNGFRLYPSRETTRRHLM